MIHEGYTVDDLAAIEQLASYERRITEAIEEKDFDKLIAAITHMRHSWAGQYDDEALDQFENDALARWDDAHPDWRPNATK